MADHEGSIFGSATATVDRCEHLDGTVCVTLTLRYGDRELVWAGTPDEAFEFGLILLGARGCARKGHIGTQRACISHAME